MKITYSKLSKIVETNQFQFEGLKVNDIDIGYFIADYTSDLGSALIKYINDNNLINLSDSISANKVNLLSELVKELSNEVFIFINNTAKSKGFLSSYDCLSYLNSDFKIFNIYATNFKKWRDAVLNIFQSYISKTIALSKKLSFTEVQSQFPELIWSNGITDEQDLITKVIEDTSALPIEELKGRKHIQIKQEYEKLFTLINPNIFFQSSICLENEKINLYFNGDIRSKNILEGLLSLNKEKYLIRTYENKEVSLTYKQLKQVVKELNENLTFLYQQRIKKDFLVTQATYKEDLDSIDMSYKMIIR